MLSSINAPVAAMKWVAKKTEGEDEPAKASAARLLLLWLPPHYSSWRDWAYHSYEFKLQSISAFRPFLSGLSLILAGMLLMGPCCLSTSTFFPMAGKGQKG